MTVWTYTQLMHLRYRVADLRAALGEPNTDADPALLAELARQHAAAQNLGEDPGYDPTYDPTHDPHQTAALDPDADHGPQV